MSIRIGFFAIFVWLLNWSPMYAVEAEQDLTVRPDLVKPQASLPSKLIKVPAVNPGEYFVPPYVADIPDDKYGDVVEWGRQIFTNTQQYGKRYVGNGLNCSSCHLAEGRQPNAAPLWAAYPRYPAYRTKTRNVVTYEERIQDCFEYSMNGIAPTVDSPEMEALVTYSHWLSTGAPTNTDLPGRGFGYVSKPKQAQAERGKEIYVTHCALCHGMDGLGQKHANGEDYMFPPIWGDDAYNRAAGLTKAKTLAEFIRANMPLGAPYSLSEQDAWDVAMYIWLQDRPDDPRMSWFVNMFVPVTPGQQF